MSWTDRRIMPFKSDKRTTFFTTAEYAERKIEENKVIAGYIRKLKTNKKRWFVLYKDTPEVPARLEYHENERRWKAGLPPSRDIVLKDCLNICRKIDSRDSKNKNVIAIYTLDDCLSILFEEEQDLQNWFMQLLTMQKGQTNDGRIPKPNFEYMWQIQVKNFKPDDPRNNFQMSGPHRLCVTMDELKFFEIGSNEAINFPIVTLRSCVVQERFFTMFTGRSSFSGAGRLVINCEDREISTSLNSAVHEAMEYHSKNRDKTGLSKHVTKALNSKDSTQSNAHRPRSESCSELDKSKTGATKHPTAPSHPRPSHTSMFSSGSRYRTTSEGNQDFHRRNKGKPSAFSGSPLSPSPGSYVSSESAGSSNSIDDTDIAPGRHTSFNEPGQTTIYEESSADSFVDPAVNRLISSESPPYSQHTRTNSDNLVHYTPVDISGPNNNRINSNSQPANRLESVSNTPTTTASNYSSTVNYSTIMNNQQQQQQQHPLPASATSDYMAMTPTSGNTSSTSSLQRNASLDQAEQRRLQLLGLNEEANRGMSFTGGSSTATITSPSSQSSYNPLDDVEDSTNPSAYMTMSPSSSVSKSIPIKPSSTQASSTKGNSRDDDEYMNMSPASAQQQQQQQQQNNASNNRKGMAIPLTDSNRNGNHRREDYELMSPVSLDPEKLRRISEEDSGTGLPPERTFNIEHSLPPTAEFTGRRRTRSRRTSFCSEELGDLSDHFMQLQQNHPLEASNRKNDVIEYENTDYLTMDYNNTSTGGPGIPIPSAMSSSPASSGTPNSVDVTKFPHEFHFESRAVSYLRQDDDSTNSNVASKSSSRQTGSMPPRALSVSSSNRAPSSSNSSLSGRSRTSSVTGSRVMDIPGGSRSKVSPNVAHKTSDCSGQSPNLLSHLGNWFRNRTGSVPSRQSSNQRRRHRTQSEGEQQNNPPGENKDPEVVMSPSANSNEEENSIHTLQGEEEERKKTPTD